MDVQLLDLDGAVAQQRRLRDLASRIVELAGWGPRLRLACGWDSFRRFEVALARILRGTRDATPTLRFLGSGDFHHLTLALLARIGRPINLLVIDNHPDWMCGVPFLHCGTWLSHAARLPFVRQVFLVGGDIDFDNHYRAMAPWSLLRSGKIVVLPAARQFTGPGWNAVPHDSMREVVTKPTTYDRIDRLIAPWRAQLARVPLYISFDRDVLREEQAASNWDAGRLDRSEVQVLIDVFAKASAGVVGMDVVGDWSPVNVSGLARRLLEWLEHPRQQVDPVAARNRNESLNLMLVSWFHQMTDLVPVLP